MGGESREDTLASIHELLNTLTEERLLTAYAECCKIISDQEAQVR